MRFSLWVAGSLTLLPLSAQSTAALAVRNVILQQDESYLEFDIANQASKPVHSWTMAIRAKVSGTQTPAEFRLTSESCSRDATGPLGPSETRHCTVSLRQATGGPTLNAEPRVTAILFEDGAVEGDTAMLDRQAAERALRVRTRQYWLDQFGEACAPGSAASPSGELEKFASMVRNPGSTVPVDLAADANCVREQRWLEQQVSNALEQTAAHNLEPAAVLRGLGADLERRLKMAKDAAALFPPRT